jgi:excinuclease ABC subunit A
VDYFEVAFSAYTGQIIIRNVSKDFEEKYSNIYECVDCHIKYEKPEQKLFAFNNPKGACPECQGSGQVYGIDENLVIPDKTLSLREQCITPYRAPSTAGIYQAMIKICSKYNVPVDVPYKELTPKQKELIWNGKDNYFGINEYFNYVESKNYKIQNRLIISKYRGMAQCRSCGGSRLKLSARQVFVNDKNIPEIVNMSILELYDFWNTIKLTDFEKKATELILSELISRTKMLIDIGLEYLTLSRSCQTLSGGEYQRINLSTALGYTLVGTLYVLDEPSIGMHPRDTKRLLDILYRLRNIGNTIVVVEHDPDIIQNADFIIDMGEGAGSNGGNIISAGTYNDLINNKQSLTAKYLNKEIKIDIPATRRRVGNKKITIIEPTENNLKIDKCEIPLHNFVVFTGVSGSGKSTLVNDVLYSGILEYKGIMTKSMKLGKYKRITGIENIVEIEMVDQGPLGRSTRSTPVTYMKIFDAIRDIFAQTQAAQQLGMKAGYFSFNVVGGRCEECEGEGFVNIDMQFLPDVKVVCESCGGTRYKKEIREVLYRGKSIVDVLDMTVDDAYQHFLGITRIETQLKLLQNVGLGYLKLGQPSSTLSGGESQRVKLASHIDMSDRTNCLYIFDEPTTGLHLDDISKLIYAINKLIDAGNSALIIEHNLSIISVADWIIDLGPDAGNNGGRIVGQGTPEYIAKLDTHTGRALAKYMMENK